MFKANAKLLLTNTKGAGAGEVQAPQTWQLGPGKAEVSRTQRGSHTEAVAPNTKIVPILMAHLTQLFDFLVQHPCLEAQQDQQLQADVILALPKSPGDT